jgi:protein-tyrosine phosphatase
MTEAGRFVDLHCHLLPGLDDGPASWPEAIGMAEMAVADGTGTIVATPHQLGSYGGNHGAAIRQHAARMEQQLATRKIPLCVLPGADVRIEPGLVSRILGGEVLTVADRKRHVLLELPHEIYLPLERLLADLKAAGMVGILTHPERNQGILGSPGVLRPLVERGCLLQVTAASLTGGFGERIRAFCEQLIRQEMVSFVSSDAHGTQSRGPGLGPAFRRVTELAGQPTAIALFRDNPARVVAGKAVEPAAAKAERAPWTKRFFWKRAG